MMLTANAEETTIPVAVRYLTKENKGFYVPKQNMNEISIEKHYECFRACWNNISIPIQVLFVKKMLLIHDPLLELREQLQYLKFLTLHWARY